MTYLEPREDDTTDIFILYFFSFVREADLEILMLFVCVSVHSNVENMSDWVTKWQSDRMTKWPSDQMTEWQDDRKWPSD